MTGVLLVCNWVLSAGEARLKLDQPASPLPLRSVVVQAGPAAQAVQATLLRFHFTTKGDQDLQ